MAFNNADWAVELPSLFGSPGEALDKNIAARERQQERSDILKEKNREFNIREQDRLNSLQEKKDMDLYRKTKMVQDLTDLSKYQTGDSVADALGGQKVAELMPKYIDMANKGASYTDLLGGITKDMQDTVSGLNGIKSELKQADLVTQKAKEVHPDINTGALLQDLRSDILNRRLSNNAFVNPLQVQQSNLLQNLGDPEFLSKYVKGSGTLENTIQNPKGVESTSALSGSPDSHVKYDAKIPFWMKPNFTPEMQKNGFLPNNFVPQLSVKNSVLNPDNIPGGIQTKSPFVIVDKDVYDRFANDYAHNLELIQATRKKYNGYDSFNPTEKEYAKRNVLNDLLTGLDQNQFHPVSSTKPSKINVSLPNQSIENNSGKLKEHFDNAFENNPHPVKSPIRLADGTTQYKDETWGDLGKTELTKPFKATIQVPKTVNGVTTYKTESVPFDKYFVGKTKEGGYKIYGAIYDRNPDGSMKNTMIKQEEIPTDEYAKRFFEKTTSVKNRASVIEDNLKDVKQPSNDVKKESKMTPAQWNDSWSKLKAGQTMVGLDGKTYTKK
jgi:hypothetical protein